MKFPSQIKFFLICLFCSLFFIDFSHGKVAGGQPLKPTSLEPFEVESDRKEEAADAPLFSSKEFGFTERKQYPGVVLLTIKDKPVGTAFFIAPDILATAFHVINDLKGPVKENLFFLDPVTHVPVAIREIVALDMESDLAILKTDYHSETFYPVGFSYERENISNREEVIIPGFPAGRFHLVKGRIAESKDFTISLNITGKDRRISSFSGNSGGPLLSKKGHLRGVLIAEIQFFGRLYIVSVQKLRDLLSEPKLSCITNLCIDEEKERVFSQAFKGDRNSQFAVGNRISNMLRPYWEKLEELAAWSFFRSEEEKKQVKRVSDMIFQIQRRGAYWYQKAALQNHSRAQFVLGKLYLQGQGVVQNFKEVVRWYREAALQDFSEAQFILGEMYLQGRGVKKDFREAFHWLHKAAQKNHSQAQFILGELYLQGLGMEKDLEKAAHWFRKAALQGHLEAQPALGRMYLYGEGVAQNLQEALHWFRKAALQGHVESQFHLGRMHLHEEEVVQDFQQALRWFREAALQGLTEAQLQLSWMYYHGKGVAKNFKEAIYWHRKVALQGHAKAQYNLGMVYYYGVDGKSDFKEAFRWFRESERNGYAQAQNYIKGVNKHYQQRMEILREKISQEFSIADEEKRELYIQALQGDRNSQFSLGVMEYKKAEGYTEELRNLLIWSSFKGEEEKKQIGEISAVISEKYKRAAHWYREAALQGVAEAQNNLGWMYYQGEGVTKDFEQALRWYREAALQDDAKASNNLGGMYSLGEGVEKDFEQALRWYREAALQGVAEAQNNLGWMYYQVEGVTKDFEQAIRWYREAALQGLAEAQNNLGWMYYQVEGVTKDFEQAIHWYREAALQGLADAQFNLGLMYYRGEGVEKDFEQAIRWYREAALQDDAKAQLQLGVMYARGEGVKKNFKESFYWLHQSARQGNSEAQYNVGAMYYKDEGVQQNFRSAFYWLHEAAKQNRIEAQNAIEQKKKEFQQMEEYLIEGMASIDRIRKRVEKLSLEGL